MRKYLAIFKISFEQEFAYKINFIMWRVRNVFQIIIAFYLWNTVFAENSTLFGYDKAKILTYVFALIIVRAFVLSARAVDVSSDIAEGNLSNHLLKPVSYFKYWITRDISSKVLNLSFAVVEFAILFVIFRPEFYFQTDPVFLMAFLASLLIAAAIYFCLLFIISSVPFWVPEMGWGTYFLVNIVILEFLSGLIFPIDVLPPVWQKFAMSLPFPYLIFFPIQVYLGKVSGASLIGGMTTSVLWAVILFLFLRYVWAKGLKAYQALGR